MCGILLAAHPECISKANPYREFGVLPSAVYGDSSSSIVLEAAGLTKASLLVVTIPDPLAMQSLVKKVKRMRPELPIVCRVKYMSERDRLLALGADDIVWEEQESGQELARRALDRLGGTASEDAPA